MTKLTKTEQNILDALKNKSWMERDFDMLSTPTVKVGRGQFLSLRCDRKSVSVHGKLAKRMVKRLGEKKLINLEIKDVHGEEYLMIHVEYQPVVSEKEKADAEYAAQVNEAESYHAAEATNTHFIKLSVIDVGLAGGGTIRYSYNIYSKLGNEYISTIHVFPQLEDSQDATLKLKAALIEAAGVKL